MRNAFAHAILRLAEADPRIVLLSGDTGNRLFDPFKQAFPERFFNCGIAEANLVSLAAGLALSGLKPVAYAIAPFMTYRCLEQIRVDLCYYRLPVVLVGVGAGLAYASLGPTHHSCEDIAVLRALPHMTLLAPADSIETGLALEAALQLSGPVYLRLGKKGEPAVHPEAFPFKLGEGKILKAGHDVLLISSGTATHLALQAASLLEAHELKVQVVHQATLKPMNLSQFQSWARDFRLWVSLEEHSLIGGLGSALAEIVAGIPGGPRLLRLGTPDAFFREAGDRAYLLSLWELTPEAVALAILQACHHER